MLHAAVLGVSFRDKPYLDLAWMSTAEVTTSLYVLLPWPLTAVVLLWLANQRPALYARAALALLLTSGTGLAYVCWVPFEHFPAHEGSLFREYLALPGALTGWYLLTAVAMATAIPSPRVRIAVATTGLGAVATSVLTSYGPGLAALFAAGVPLLAWWVAGRLLGQQAWRRQLLDAWDPQGRVVSSRTRTPVRVPAPRPVPSRQAG
ncbi:hypothetical protein AB0O67_05150 [Streptomyces sp. NPDC086077]|uniref:hypothetical protein n=1 Tax=Streptomyces sp. NPDC086077 TaxID=3154862 RepID=UPI003427C555